MDIAQKILMEQAVPLACRWGQWRRVFMGWWFKEFQVCGNWITTMPFKLRSLRHFILLYGPGDYSLSGYRGEIIWKQPNRVIHMSFPQLIMMFKNCKIPKTFQLEVGLLGVARGSRTTTTLGLGRNRTYHAKAAKHTIVATCWGLAWGCY